MEQVLHPFAKYIAILARGKTKVRALTLEEAQDSMGIILRGEAEREQIGAFLMLLRLKKKSHRKLPVLPLRRAVYLICPMLFPRWMWTGLLMQANAFNCPGFYSLHWLWHNRAPKCLCMVRGGIRRVGFIRARRCNGSGCQLRKVWMKQHRILRRIFFLYAP